MKSYIGSLFAIDAYIIRCPNRSHVHRQLFKLFSELMNSLGSFLFPSLHFAQFATKQIHQNHIDIIPVYGRAKNGYAVKQ